MPRPANDRIRAVPKLRSRPRYVPSAHRPSAAPTRNRTWPMIVAELRARVADEASMNDMPPTIGREPKARFNCSAARDIPPEEVREGPRQRRDGEHGADPRGPDHRGPVDRVAQQALPRVELLGQQVRA